MSSKLNQPPVGYRVSRRHFLQKFGASSVTVLLSNCSKKGTVTFGTSCLGLSQKEKTEITRAIAEYGEKYGLITPIVIELSDLSKEAKILQNGTKQATLEIAKRGTIMIDPRAIRKDEIVLHALSHANQIEGYESELSEFTLEVVGSTEKPDKIYGYQGFSILVETSNGEKTAIRLIEEGVCEALVYGLRNQHRTRTYEYAVFASLILKLLKRKKISPTGLAHMIQRHQVKKFIGLLFDTEVPSQEQIVEVMEWFMALANGVPIDEVTHKAFQHIQEKP